jgi:hypothetical protein
MTMNQPLVPTRIVNKNGVLTTVHKKPAGAPLTAGTIPAPAAVPSGTKLTAKERRDIKVMLIDEVSNACEEWNSNWSYENLEASLNSYNDATIAAIRDYLPTIPPSFAGDEDRGGFLFTLVKNTTVRVSGSTVHEYIVYKSCFPQGATASSIMSYVRALHSYPQLPVMDSYAEADEATTAKVTALLRVTNDLNMRSLQDIFLKGGEDQPEGSSPLPVTYAPEPKITDDSIVDLIVERPDLADEIADLIITKKVRDGALIREMIESKTQSIRDGLL